MKNLTKLLLLAALSLLCAPAKAATLPAVVQSASTFCTSCTTVTLSYPSNSTAGNGLIVWTIEDNAPPTTSPTCCGMGTPDTWTIGCLHCGTTVGSPSMFYVCSTVGGAQTIQVVSHSFSNSMHIIVEEVSGLVAASCLDTVGQLLNSTPLSVVSGTGGCPPNGCGASVVSSPVEYCGGYFTSWNQNTTYTAGTGYTILQQVNDPTGNDASMLEDNNTRSGLSGTQTATATNTSPGVGNSNVIACFLGIGTSLRHRVSIY